MRVRVTVVLDSPVESIGDAASKIAAIKKAVEELGTVQSWKEQVLNR